jgi:hypothetical protein
MRINQLQSYCPNCEARAEPLGEKVDFAKTIKTLMISPITVDSTRRIAGIPETKHDPCYFSETQQHLTYCVRTRFEEVIIGQPRKASVADRLRAQAHR